MIDIVQIAALGLLCLGKQKPNYSRSTKKREGVTFSIYGVSGDLGIVSPMRVDAIENQTVLEVSLRVLKEQQIPFEVSGVGSNASIKTINNLRAVQKGKQNSWLYKVNNKFPNEGPGEYKVKNGDKVQWVYALDLGKEQAINLNSLTRQNNYVSSKGSRVK